MAKLFINRSCIYYSGENTTSAAIVLLWFTIWRMEHGWKRDVEDRAGTFERVKYETPEIGENFYVFKKFINKEL